MIHSLSLLNHKRKQHKWIRKKKTFFYYPYFVQSNWNQKSKQVNRKNCELSIQSFLHYETTTETKPFDHSSLFLLHWNLCKNNRNNKCIRGKNSRPHRQLFTCLISIITLIRAMETNILSIRNLSNDFSLNYATTAELWKAISYVHFFVGDRMQKSSICRKKRVTYVGKMKGKIKKMSFFLHCGIRLCSFKSMRVE